MRFGLVCAAIAATLLSGCYPYAITGDDVVLTDQRLVAAGIQGTPGAPLGDVGAGLGLVVTEEVIEAPFGRIALTRFEHATPRPLIMFCGGNMCRREIGGQRIVSLLAPLGDVWIFDYPGYGDSSGEGAPAQFMEMSQAIAGRVDRAFTEGRTNGLTFWGHSLGGTVCADIAGRSATPSNTALVATFQSFEQVIRAGASARVGPLASLVKPVVADDVPTYDIAKSLDGYGGTVVVVAARNDAVVPFLASERLDRALRREGVDSRMVVLLEGDHSRIHEVPGLIARIAASLSATGPGV